MKILIGFEATYKGRQGLNLALQQAKAFNADVHILSSLMIGEKARGFASKARPEAEQRIAEVKRFFEDAGLTCHTQITARGQDQGEDIVQYASENGIDLIIVGVRIRSLVGKILLGSTAQYVILKAPCPVLTFKDSVA
jgi:nucleotide-binding universal stress UspA family protein